MAEVTSTSSPINLLTNIVANRRTEKGWNLRMTHSYKKVSHVGFFFLCCNDYKHSKASIRELSSIWVNTLPIYKSCRIDEDLQTLKRVIWQLSGSSGLTPPEGLNSRQEMAEIMRLCYCQMTLTSLWPPLSPTVWWGCSSLNYNKRWLHIEDILASVSLFCLPFLYWSA